jgi:3-oxoadipate enol-lactonase/4-carboxymuconolactone decarboxylase
VSTPRITGVELAGGPSLPLLVLGPSLGTGAVSLWGAVAARLGSAFHVIGWNLPGHDGAPVGEPFTIAELAAGVQAYIDGVRRARADDRPYAYAGDSVGGAVGLRLLLDSPGALGSTALLCTGAKIGDADAWHQRAATVRASGTPTQVTGSAQRWFAPGFLERRPGVATALLGVLRDTDAEGYAQTCDALAAFDVRDRLGEITVPVLAVAGAYDVVTPPDTLRRLTSAVRDGRLVVLDDVGHLAPAEDPEAVARLLRDHIAGTPPGRESAYAAGTAMRVAVLGEEHVARATAGITDVTRDFQDLITRYAWGDIWARPGLLPRDRSIAVLTALVAGRHFDELEFHLRAALRNGLTRQEIIEVLLQTAIYVGVPAANTAFAVANRVLNESGEQT